MFGLKNCTEDDFEQFKYSNSRYYPNNINARIFGGLLCSIIFFGIASFYLYQSHIKCPSILKYGIEIFIIFDALMFILCTVNKNKFAYKTQNMMMIVVILNWLVMAFCIYPIPLIIAYYDKSRVMINCIYAAMGIGLIYFLFKFSSMIYLIKKGQMRKGGRGLYDKLLGKKAACAGVSVPIIVIVGKLARRATIEMDNSGLSTGPVIMMILFAFVMQIAMIGIIPECIIISYCKFRFDSFYIPPEDSYKNNNKSRKRRNK